MYEHYLVATVWKKLSINIFLISISLLLTFFILEIGYRFYQFIRYETPMFSSRTGLGQRAYLDSEFGWRNADHFSIEKVLEDAGGNRYYAKVSNQKYGFKLFGNNNSNSKILIVGDSFTDANEVSNDKTYWAILANKLKNLQFYVYGCGGYGNLQEFMVIDKYIDEIKPQILLLQLCSNDFINNDYNLESISYENNNGLRRPYINSQGEIFYKNPKHFRALPEFWLQNSRIFFFLNFKVQVLYQAMKGHLTIEKEIEKTGMEHEKFRHAAELTAIIMKKIKDRAAGVKIYAFCVNYQQPYTDELQRLAESLDFAYIDGIPQAVEACEKSGYITRAADKGHWNELGHKVVGEKLFEYFSRNGIYQRDYCR